MQIPVCGQARTLAIGIASVSIELNRGLVLINLKQPKLDLQQQRAQCIGELNLRSHCFENSGRSSSYDHHSCNDSNSNDGRVVLVDTTLRVLRLLRLLPLRLPLRLHDYTTTTTTTTTTATIATTTTTTTKKRLGLL